MKVLKLSLVCAALKIACADSIMEKDFSLEIDEIDLSYYENEA